MKFEYSTAAKNGQPFKNERGRIVKRPILQLLLTDKNGGEFIGRGMVDSGADTTTVNIEYAEVLGVPLDKANPLSIMGIGETKPVVYPGTFVFEIKDMRTKIEVPAWYIDSPNVDILLGQEDFFDQFRIKFERDHNAFEITPAPKK